MARLAEQTGHYADMSQYMKIVLQEKGPEMDHEERKLLQISHKKNIQAQRDTLNVVKVILSDEQYFEQHEECLHYKKILEQRIYSMAYEFVSLLKKQALSLKGEDEPRAFFLKLCGDFLRYAAEVSPQEKRYQVKTEARQIYEEANRIPLRATNVTKL